MFRSVYRALENVGDCSIEVFEWNQADVRKKRLPKGPLWSSLAKAHPPLRLNGWRLAHAVVKLDYLIKTDLEKKAFGLLCSLEDVVDFGPGKNLRLCDGVKNGLADFYGFSLSGRLGQGLSLLFAQDTQGYRFVGHLASDVAVKAHLASNTAQTKKAADFVFENDKKERMILESKSSFRQDDNDPSKVKSKLKNALEGQVDYWMGKIKPNAQKGFAVYSCFRELSSPVPSALIFVDPPEGPSDDIIPLSEASVRRQNYAAWLEAMDLRDAADRLRGIRAAEHISYQFVVLEIRGERFAFYDKFDELFWECRFFIAGIELRALKAVGEALQGEEGALLNLEALQYDGLGEDRETFVPYSIFPDGTFLGNPLGDQNAKYIETIRVVL